LPLLKFQPSYINSGYLFLIHTHLRFHPSFEYKILKSILLRWLSCNI